jgi:hypothetical protein
MDPKTGSDRLCSLDIQFRLLRADATKALKVGIQMVLRELNSEDYLNTSGRS